MKNTTELGAFFSAALANDGRENAKGVRAVLEAPMRYSTAELCRMVFDKAKGMPLALTDLEEKLIQQQAELLAKENHEILAMVAAASILESTRMFSIAANLMHNLFHSDAYGARSEQKARSFKQVYVQERKAQTQAAKRAADTLHNKKGGSREKRKAIRDIWASGKYDSRDRCAEEECGALGMSFGTARKALRNAPKPN